MGDVRRPDRGQKDKPGALALLMVFAIAFSALLLASRAHPIARRTDFQQGFSYVKWGSQFADHADRSFRPLKALGARWISFVPMYYMDHPAAFEIYQHPVLSPTDDELVAAIQKAQALGFKILLKPHIDVMKDDWKSEWPKGDEAWLARYRAFVDRYPINGPRWQENWFRRLFTWRGEIHPANPADVSRWFDGYIRYIVHFAELAQRLGVEQFCIGTELERLKGYSAEWERVIHEVRKVYAGAILYDTNHNSFAEVPFWEKLDYVGISAYYPLSQRSNPSEREMRRGLNSTLDGLESYFQKLSRQYGREFKVLFSEAGYTDFRGTARTPWDFLLTAGISADEQARAYRVSLDLYPRREWLKGVYFWRWSVEPEDKYFDYDHYSPYGKAAEIEINKAWNRGVQ